MAGADHPIPMTTPAPAPVQRTHPAAWLWLSLVVIALDQATKLVVTRLLELYERVEVLPVLDFTLLHNTGAAFSMFAGASGWQRGFFITLGGIVSIVLVVWIWRLPRGSKLLPLALGLILGGALGNVIDRLMHGHVVDFLDFHFAFLQPLFPQGHFPAFNVADSAITVGAACLIIDELRRVRRT